MAKKTDSTTKPAALNGAAPAAPTPVKRTVKPAAKAKPAGKKAKAPLTKARRITKKTVATTKPRYTQDDVALRAYFISEKRRAHGIPGDEHHDWLEAERQLLAESLKPKKAKKA
ncbi:MAG: DUF2934 domain-containing protein [Chthoniobacter sp.]|uniref:DUF2934 domain-containing protein n=1 Tax=Chthoniobacter sp. TaxID=2510640 RepID=UPI0032AAD33A